MKYILYLIIFAGLVPTACNKNREAQPGSFIKYVVNGEPVEIRGDFNLTSRTGVSAGRFDKVRNGFQNTFYKIQGHGGTKNIITLSIPVDSLETKTYYLDTALYFASTQGGVDVITNNAAYTLLRGSDYTRINITSYSQGLISGTFQGVMSRYDLATNSYTQATITEGFFHKLKIVYL